MDWIQDKIEYIKAKRYYSTHNKFLYDLVMLLDKEGNKQRIALLIIYLLSALVAVILAYEHFVLWFVLLVIAPAICFIAIVAVERISLAHYKKFEMFDASTGVQRHVSGTMGHAAWETLDGMKKHCVVSKDINEVNSMILGKYKGNLIAVKDGGQSSPHTFISGYSGGNKGVGYVINTVAQGIMAGHSVIAMSTKSDIYRILAWCAKNRHCTVKLLYYTEAGIVHSDAVDYLSLIKGEDIQKQNTANAMSQVIVENTETTDSPNFWLNGYINLLAALLLLFADGRKYNNKKGFGALYAFLTDNSDLEKLTAYLDVYIEKGHLAYEPYKVFRGTPGKSDNIRNSVVQGLASKLRPLQPDVVKDVVSHDEVDLAKPGKEQCVYFLVVEKEYKFLASLYLSMQIRILKQMAEANKDGRLDVPVDFVLDEFFACGKIPDFNDAIDVVRSYKMKFTVCSQSISQIDELYGRNMRADFLNNCGYQLLLNTRDDLTAKHFSEQCGNYTGVSKMKNKDTGKETEREVAVPLLSVDQALNMEKDTVVIVPQSGNPMKLSVQKYYEDWPGSRIEVLNNYDGKIYHSHPIFENAKQLSANKHTPAWAKAKKQGNKSSKDKDSKEKPGNDQPKVEYEFTED